MDAIRPTRFLNGYRGALFLVIAILVMQLGLTAVARGDIVYDKNVSSEASPNGWNLWLGDTGSDPQLLPYSGVNPALDSSGGRITYATRDGYFVSSVHTGQTTQLPAGPAGCVYLTQAEPQWTPDGIGVLTDSGCDIQLSLDLGDGWQTKTAIDWPGRQFAPSMSPDGTHIAFISNTNYFGRQVDPNNPDHYAVFMSSATGQGYWQMTSADPNDPNAVYPFTTSWSPDGNNVVFEGYDNNSVGGSDSEIYSVRGTSGIITQITEDDQQEWGADWAPSGQIVFAAGNDSQTAGQFHAINPDGTGEIDLSAPFSDGYYIGTPSARQTPGTGGADGSWTNELLWYYSPLLLFDKQETFFPDSAAEMTDFSGTTITCPGPSIIANSVPCAAANDYKDSSGTVLAGHGGGLPVLSLNYLGNLYPPRDRSGDYIDAEQNSDVGYALAANLMREDPDTGWMYGDKSYGRVVYKGGLFWLQYWYFYYDNPYNPFFIDGGEHEGDWEMMQIGLDPSSMMPQEVVYSQHDGAEVCPWSVIPKTFDPFGSDRQTPIDYVGAGSHANYFSAGDAGYPVVGNTEGHNGNRGNIPGTGGGQIIDVTAPPAWMSWPGRWGSTRNPVSIGPVNLGGDSPQGPLFHSAWQDPDGYAADAHACSISASTNTAAPATMTLPAPLQLSASGQSGQALVSYQLGSATMPSAHRRILLTIQGSGDKDTPIGGLFDANSATGSQSLPFPAGTAPYIVRASVMMGPGQRSPIVTTTLPGQ